jgi:L-seryl-tRNA(Ser) seleniumtransferase
MLSLPFDHIEKKAEELGKMLESIGDARVSIKLINLTSRAGGGALPLLNLPSKGVGVEIDGISANSIEESLRKNELPIIGRIEDDIFIMDLRTVHDDELLTIKNTFNEMLKKA